MSGIQVGVKQITLTNHRDKGGMQFSRWTGECTVCEEPLTKATASGDSPEEVLEKLRHQIAEIVFEWKVTACDDGCMLRPGHADYCDRGD